VTPRLFIKIDVEGPDLMVLEGMSETLQLPQLALMVEVKHRAPEVFRLLSAAGFRGFSGHGKPILDPSGLDDNSSWLKDGDPRMRVLCGEPRAN
jgi:hypothetical protein